MAARSLFISCTMSSIDDGVPPMMEFVRVVGPSTLWPRETFPDCSSRPKRVGSLFRHFSFMSRYDDDCLDKEVESALYFFLSVLLWIYWFHY